MASINTAVATFAESEKQRRLFASVASSQPVLEAMQANRGMREQILESFARSPALEAFTGRHQEMREQILKAVGQSPALAEFPGKSREWRDQILKAVDASSVLDSFNTHQQERHRQLLAAIGKSPAMEQVFKNWKLKLPPGLAEQMVAYQAGLLADIASQAGEEESEVWFGAESWSRLVWEMVAILRCVELTTAGMWAAKDGLGASVPSAVFHLLWIFIAAGELAAHFAENAIDGD